MIMEKFQSIVEKRIFGVCEYIGKKIGIKTSKIRLFFIYASFLTFGSPVIIYLILAFLLEQKDQFKARRSTIWDL
jgi:phage shock protein C